MKKCLLILSALISLALLLFPNKAIASHAEENPNYSYRVNAYTVTATMHRDHTLQVTEVIDVTLTGRDSHGIIRDLSINNGELISGITASCDHADFHYQTIDEVDGYLSVYLRGDAVATGQNRTYTLNYEVSVPDQENKDALTYDVIPYGWSMPLNNVTAYFILDSEIAGALSEYDVWYGKEGESAIAYDSFAFDDGTISITADYIPSGYGISVEARFVSGTLVSRTYGTIVGSDLITAGIIAAITLLAALVFRSVYRQREIVPVVNFTAPEEMDPLQMGKYIDNAVDNEDITSLIYYWADKGYIKIDFSDPDDPVLLRVRTALPDGSPQHQKTMYDALFAHGDRLVVSSLKNSFYKTAESVKMLASSSVGNLYEIKSYLVSAIPALCSAAALIVQEFLRFRAIGGGYVAYMPLLLIVPALLGYIFGVGAAFVRWKKKPIAAIALTAVAALGIGLFRAYSISLLAHLIASIVLAAVCFLYGNGIRHTASYAKTLGQIIGFKNFILYTEKDKLKFMLETSPELYYHILPYAQVLGVTKEWTKRFEALTIDPPSWAVGYRADVFDVIVIHSLLRSTSHAMASSMLSKPSGNGGGISGGFGGGFSGGGGFGGGGGRGC